MTGAGLSTRVAERVARSVSDSPHLQALVQFYFMYRPLIVLSMIVYLALIHLGFMVLFWRSDVPGKLAWQLGIGSRWVELSNDYRRKARVLSRLDDGIAPDAVLFVGDSLMSSLDVGALIDHPVQLSIAGETVRRTVARIVDYRSLTTARGIVFHVGTNDLRYRRGAAFEEPFRRMLRLVPPRVPVILSAILPVDERVFRHYDNRAIADANARLAAICAERPGCRFIETGAGLTDATGSLDPRHHVGDGLHLNGDGYRAWLPAMRAALAPWRQPAPPPAS